ncbi:PEPxxWA-CTERM sorting domain-containing protein [Sandarakinorhabdus rubra]|uniref:PEPxxWA-CTERM sorting domain-containing protein n=1 Tax=Sandarakinorhabdus rubra TaxID=2672568 RepID=UPI001F2242A5|nr:PEPxxWA-CTERM sorting domain-containing protein [Sandarakinorhabdus rubra]
MRTISMFLAGTAMALAAPAMATFNVTIGNPVTGIPGNNDFRAMLNRDGLYAYTAGGAAISLSLPSTTELEFEFLGSESGFSDKFKVGGTTMFSETSGGRIGNNNPANPWTILGTGSANYGAGPITDWLFTSNNGAKNKGIGTLEFGIFLPRGFEPGDIYRSRVLYLGFDDQITGDDDNHDDMIVRVTVGGGFNPEGIPEPSSWAMLIAGFGLVGAARRRRRAAIAA